MYIYNIYASLSCQKSPLLDPEAAAAASLGSQDERSGGTSSAPTPRHLYISIYTVQQFKCRQVLNRGRLHSRAPCLWDKLVPAACEGKCTCGLLPGDGLFQINLDLGHAFLLVEVRSSMVSFSMAMSMFVVERMR